jgi:hypothetical protein
MARASENLLTITEIDQVGGVAEPIVDEGDRAGNAAGMSSHCSFIQYSMVN